MFTDYAPLIGVWTSHKARGFLFFLCGEFGLGNFTVGSRVSVLIMLRSLGRNYGMKIRNG